MDKKHGSSDGCGSGGGPCPPVALQELLGRCLGRPSVALMLLEKLEEQVVEDMMALEHHLGLAESEGLARVAHGLKGAAGSVGAVGLREAASCIERQARANDLEAVRASVLSLRQEVDRCLMYLPDARAELGGASAGGAPAGGDA